MVNLPVHFRGFGLKKNLTEINHKVSLIAKWLFNVFAGVFVEICIGGCGNPHEILEQSLKLQPEPPMQETIANTETRESHVSVEMRASLRDLNHRFFDLIAARTQEWTASAAGDRLPCLAGQVAPLSRAQRAAAAACPYALFNLRFEDEAHWRLRLQNVAPCRVEDELIIGDDTSNFARLALFFAWHAAASAGLAAQLLLGMNGSTAAALRRLTLNDLPALVATEAPNLRARWSDCGAYWSALTSAAGRDDSAALRRVHLYGLQLTAAARLPQSWRDGQAGRIGVAGGALRGLG